MSLEDISFEQRDQLASLMKELSDNPSTREDVLRLTKKLKPELVIPELDIKDNTRSYVEKLEARLSERDAKDRERDALDDLNKRRMALVKKGLAGEDDIEDVEKLMLEKGITDHETAAEYHRWMKQAAVPTSSGYNPSPLKNWDLNKFMKDPVRGARNEAANALNELRKSPRPIGL